MFPINFIQNLSKILSKFSLKSCHPDSQKFSWNFNKFFWKFSQKFSHNLNKTLLENCSNFNYSLSKVSWKFYLFSRISKYFQVLSQQHFHNQLIRIFKYFLKNLRKFFYSFVTVLRFLENFILFFLKFSQNIDVDDFYLV